MEHSIRLFGDRCKPMNDEEDCCFQDLEMAVYELPLHLNYARSWTDLRGSDANVMRIVKPGRLPEEVRKMVTCGNCNSVLEVLKKDTSAHSQPRDSYRTCVCEFCKKDIYLDIDFFEWRGRDGIND